MIRPATFGDWPDIATWRNRHFEALGVREVTGQAGLCDAAWLVYERRGQPVAAIAFRDDAERRVRHVTDLYGAPGHALAGEALGAYVEGMSDFDGYEIVGSTDPGNAKYLELLLTRGYEVTAIHFRRKSKKGAPHGSVVG